MDRKINIQAVTLKGNGTHRVLKQVKGDHVNSYDYLVSRADFCYNTCFGFFGLSAGEYNLTIEAEGYRPIVKNYPIMPGVLEYFRITELTP